MADRDRHPLTVPLWIIAVAMVIGLLLDLAPLLFPTAYMSRFAQQYVTDDGGELRPQALPDAFLTDPDVTLSGFSSLPVDRQLELASAIVIAEYSGPEGEEVAIITEILKLAEGTEFNYQVGDEFWRGIRREPGVEYGDGEIAFFVGSPATLTYTMTFYHGRMLGLGEMTLDQLRERIAGLDQP